MIAMQSLVGKRAAVVLYGYYPTDTRVHRSTEALIEAGMQVDLLCLTETPEEPLREKVEGADVFRTAGPAYRAAHAGHLSLHQLRIMSAGEQCRTGPGCCRRIAAWVFGVVSSGAVERHDDPFPSARRATAVERCGRPVVIGPAWVALLVKGGRRRHH